MSVDRSHIAAATSREELIYLLSRAAELEHALACTYLFAAYSLKTDTREGGITQAQVEMVGTWKRFLASVAIEEMLHLAQVTNILTAIGGAPHFKRSNFPMPAAAFPFALPLTLEPFSQQTLERFLCYEMPEDGTLSEEQTAVYAPIRARVLQTSADRTEAKGEEAPVGLRINRRGITRPEPFDVDFTTVGELYHKIKTGIEAIPEAQLFIGPRAAQANARFVHFGDQLISVVDHASARAAIAMVVEQGEAPSPAHPEAHFTVFDRIRLEYVDALARAQASGVAFEPARAVASNPITRFYEDTSEGALIEDLVTHTTADVFNFAYDTMLLILLRFFAHTDESEAELEHLSRVALRLMTTVIRPLGEALTKMPMGSTYPGQTAGPGFGYNRDVHLLPHKTSAWTFFTERLLHLEMFAAGLPSEGGLPAEIGKASKALQSLVADFGKLKAEDPVA